MTVQEIHKEYCRLINGTLALTLDRMYWWEAWKKEGFTIEDLRQVVSSLQQRIKKGERNLGCLKWSNLIQSGKFGEELAESKAWKCNTRRVPTSKETVREQWSPTIGQKPVADSCVHVSDVIRAMREAAR